MNDDEELNRLARDRYRAVLAELEQEEAMSKSIPRPPHYRDVREEKFTHPETGATINYDKSPGYEPPPPRWLAWGLIVFWVLVIGGIALLYSCKAEARTQVYLEDERDLGNGYKLCIYSEGITITKPSHQLCPISIEV